jgi:hypothetical protein
MRSKNIWNPLNIINQITYFGLFRSKEM